MSDWILVNERLPKELTEVLITWVNREPPSYYMFIKDIQFTGVGIYYHRKWWWWSAVAEDLLAEYGKSPADEMDERIDVIAWMPLPKPCGERRTDDSD